MSVSWDQCLKVWNYVTGMLLSSISLEYAGLYVVNIDSSHFVVAAKGELNIFGSIDYTKRNSLTYDGYGYINFLILNKF